MSTTRTRIARPTAAVVALAGALALASMARATTHGVSLSTKGGRTLESCDQVRPEFKEHDRTLPTVREEKRFTLPRGSTPLLEMHLEAQGGIAVAGHDGPDYAVTACLAAAGADDARAADVMRRVDVGFDHGRLALHGPEDENWMVYFIVRVPKDAALDLRSANAPIDLRDVGGRIKVRVQNGPIALDDCRGDIDVEAENGPVSTRAGGGHQHLYVTNGPLDIALDGGRWDGAGIDAHAENGPLRLSIPKDYSSGVSVAVSDHSPLQCSAGCGDAGQTAPDGTRRLHFGPAQPVIRVSAENGPVKIDAGSKPRHEASI